MTFRELALKLYPKFCGGEYIGGVVACPGTYLKGQPVAGGLKCTRECKTCWGQEIPGTTPTPKRTPIVYIAGPISGVPGYKRAFNKAENELQTRGYIPLKPSWMPLGMTPAQYMRIRLAMIDSADAVLVLPGSITSDGFTVEYTYAKYIGKPTAHSIDNLEEVLKNA